MWNAVKLGDTDQLCGLLLESKSISISTVNSGREGHHATESAPNMPNLYVPDSKPSSISPGLKSLTPWL